MIPIIGRIFGKRETSENLNRQDSRINVTVVNLKFMGNTHGLGGIKSDKPIFELDIPFQNKMGSELLPNNIKGPKIRIDKISVAGPFALLDISPKLPVDVEFMSRAVFRLRIKGPDVRYEGPLSVNFGNDPAGTVNIGIGRIILHHNGKDIELENSQIISNMQRSQVFRQGIQLYRIMSLGDTLNNIAINRPFEVIDTEPKLPVNLNKKDSYIINIFIKAPDVSYSGNLDIVFE
ncbi:MAG: hypothetical protein M1569_02625 [Candidatus Marsarchaeota archaeon]|nr:hypothetical protein [Candidatus Marsarchaeota archaeon]MCL5413275.1 hypothetical protein [Candidatus Marsarchaeota archaeon]